MGHKKKEIQHNKDNLQVKSEERSQDDRCTSDTAWPGQSGAAAQVTGVEVGGQDKILNRIIDTQN